MSLYVHQHSEVVLGTVTSGNSQ